MLSLTHWHSSQMRKAPSVASSWLSWMSTLITCTGCSVSCSLEFKSRKHIKDQVKAGNSWRSSKAVGLWMTPSNVTKPHPPPLGHRLSLHRWWPGQTCPCSSGSALALIWSACCGPACAGCRFVCIWRARRVKEYTARGKKGKPPKTKHSKQNKTDQSNTERISVCTQLDWTHWSKQHLYKVHLDQTTQGGTMHFSVTSSYMNYIAL